MGRMRDFYHDRGYRLADLNLKVATNIGQRPIATRFDP